MHRPTARHRRFDGDFYVFVGPDVHVVTMDGFGSADVDGIDAGVVDDTCARPSRSAAAACTVDDV